MFWFGIGTMHTAWVKNKTHETSTFKQMINGVQEYLKKLIKIGCCFEFF